MAYKPGPNQRYSTPNRSIEDSQLSIMGGYRKPGAPHQEGFRDTIAKKLDGGPKGEQLLKLHGALMEQYNNLTERRRAENASRGQSPKASSSTADWVGRPTVKK